VADLGSLLPLPVVLPIVGATAAPLLSRWSVRLSTVVSLGLLAGSAVLLAMMAPAVFAGRVLVHYLGRIGPVDGHVLGVTFAADSWGLTYALVVAVVGALLLLFMLSEQDELGRRESGGLSCLFQLLVAALIGGALTADLINLFVWFEVAALASYALTGFFLERPLALEAAFKILVLTNVASFVIFVAAALLYASHGALNLGQLHGAIGGRPGTVALVALGLLLVGFATKAGLAPFHGWLPDAHTAAPGPVSALFSGLMVNFGILAIARLVYSGYASVGLIHEALAERHAYGPLAVMVLAQVGTVAALGRAAATLYARPGRTASRTEPLRPGMFAALALLGGACVAFGVLAPVLVRAVFAPAAQALLDGAGYARAVLTGGGRTGATTVTFDYLNPAELLAVAATVVLGILLARLAGRHRDTPARLLRHVQTGSVNDYAAYQAAGLVLAVAAILASAPGG
jgi:multicomponent Na+:H+ antiporter subunit D